jgi:hypothetical protein
MCANKDDRRPGLIWSVLTSKCSRCRRGDMFLHPNPYDLKNLMKMPENCLVCGQPFEIEVGFYYGTSFVSYTLAVIFCAVSFILWKLIIGMSLHDNSFFWWLGVNAVLLIAIQPILMRISRTVWLNFFVHYDPEWQTNKPASPERTNPDLKNDW